jgi:ribosomal protein L36
MKVRSALKLMCANCFFVRRRNRLFVLCKRVAKHKQRQGFATAAPQIETMMECCTRSESAAVSPAPGSIPLGPFSGFPVVGSAWWVKATPVVR